MLYLLCFDFKLIHKVGSLITKADSLSRKPDHEKRVENDNSDITLLKPKFFQIQATRQRHLVILDNKNKLLSMIRDAKEWDKQVVKVAENLEKSKTKRSDMDE